MAPEVSAAALEVPHRFGEPQAQLDWIAAHLPAAELVVLPEAALTGYVSPEGDFDLAPFAEPRGGATERAFIQLARERGCALLAPLIERDGRSCYNAALFIDASGAVLARYRKRHPWFPESWATPGEDPPPLFGWRGFTLTIAICFDLNFLGEDAARELAQADALLFPSAWTERRDSRPALLCDLARRFGCMVLNANWGVGVPRVPGQGNSMAVSASGALLDRGGPVCHAALSRRTNTCDASETP